MTSHSVFEKWGEAVSTDTNRAQWYAQIGYNGQSFSDLTLTDNMASDGSTPQYIADSFELNRVEDSGVWTPISLDGKLTINDDSFTLHLGALNGRYILTYQTTYQPGATLNNSITATDAGTDDGTYTSLFHSVKGSGDINGDENQKPTVPDTPDQPETPQKPEAPTQPETPKTPEQPAKPTEPEQPTTPEEPQKVVVTPPTHEKIVKKITQETQSDKPEQAKSGTKETNEEPAKQEQAQEPNALPQTGDAVAISGTIILLLIVACAALIVVSVIRNERK